MNVPTAARERSSFSHMMLRWRSDFRFGGLEVGLLTAYAAVLVLVLPHHERWADEAQAWLIARDNTLWQIFRYRLHYEGSPGLWHLVLHTFQLLGGSYTGMNWLGAAFALAGVIVFLRWSPFPLLIRILLPFTFFLQYQYAVIARGYTLFPLLVFCLCALFRSRRRPFCFAAVAGLLANISLQGTVFSFLLVILYLFEFCRKPGERLKGRSLFRPLLRPASVYLALLVFAAFTAVPAPDCGIANGPPVVGGPMQQLLMRFPGPLPRSEAPPRPPSMWKSTYLLAPDYAVGNQPIAAASPLRHPGAWVRWFLHHQENDRPRPLPPRRTSQSLLETTVEMLTLLTAPVSDWRLLSCSFLACLGVWLWQQRSLRMLLPWLANILVAEALWVADHHIGLLFLALLAAVWLAAPHPHPDVAEERVRLSSWLNNAFIILLALVCISQIAWSALAIRNDIYERYDPGNATASYLAQRGQKNVAAIDFVAVGVQPYFNKNIFSNWHSSYWVWAMDNPNRHELFTLEQHPDMVLFSQDLLASGFTHNDWAPLSPVTSRTQDRDLNRSPFIIALWLHGYRETHRFCGERFFRLSASYRSCDVIYEPQ